MNNLRAIGKRKTAIARVLLRINKKGPGILEINKLDYKFFFKDIIEEVKKLVWALRLSKIVNRYNIFVQVKGGGKSSQLDATCLALSKALCKTKENMLQNNLIRKNLKKCLYLRSDSRIKERRKYGLKKARKASQYSKR
jgi:small subunit ribosomal protein S9